jgi:hypothetical protein
MAQTRFTITPALATTPLTTAAAMSHPDPLLPAPIVDEIARMFAERYRGRFIYLERKGKWWDAECRKVQPPIVGLVAQIVAELEGALLTMSEQRPDDPNVLKGILLLRTVYPRAGFHRIILRAVRRLPGMATDASKLPGVSA